ncbi:MAG: 30S ribosomal protein S16 [Planctomycetes bacterium]|nr:30S ribosomal protein S16 [Planctomycetota bacterium]
MSVVIRLRRTGRKNLPCFRINVTDSRFPRDGRMLETIGLYDPLRKDPAAQVVVNAERAKHWIEHGAEVSEVVASILRRKGLKDLLRQHKLRERPGRSAKTKTRATRDARTERLSKAKTERRATRLKARRAAKKAAASAEPKS